MFIGQVYKGKPKKLTLERVLVFSGKNNIHSDISYAKSCGLNQTYVSATQYLGYISELLVNLFGVEWLTHGKISDTKLVKPVSIGDTLQATCRIIEIENNIITLEIKCINQHKEDVLIGEATGINNG